MPLIGGLWAWGITLEFESSTEFINQNHPYIPWTWLDAHIKSSALPWTEKKKTARALLVLHSDCSVVITIIIHSPSQRCHFFNGNLKPHDDLLTMHRGNHYKQVLLSACAMYTSGQSRQRPGCHGYLRKWQNLYVFQFHKVMRIDNLVLHHSVSECVINKFVLLSVRHTADCMLIRLPTFPCNNLSNEEINK